MVSSPCALRQRRDDGCDGLGKECIAIEIQLEDNFRNENGSGSCTVASLHISSFETRGLLQLVNK
jgi:hypothetical protein